MKNILYITLSVTLLFSCTNTTIEVDHHDHGHGHNDHGHDEHAEHGNMEGIVLLSDAQAASIDLKIGGLSKMPFSEVIETNGVTELDPQNIADIHVLIGGVIDNIRVIEGSKVKKGSILASVKHPDIIKLQEDLISQNAQLSYVENEYQRQETLYKEKVGSGKEYQKIKAEYDGLKALTDALKAKLKILGMDPEMVLEGKIAEVIYVRSPLNGKVSLVDTKIGEFVSTDRRLFQVVDNSHVHAALRVYENDIMKIREDQKVEVTSPAVPDKKFTATIYAISPAFEDNPKNVHVHADFDIHDDRLISGMYISGKITTAPKERVVVPRAAVTADEKYNYIFMQEEEGENEFRRVAVKTGIEEGDWIEIVDAAKLPKDIQIALNGAYYLLAELDKGEMEHSH